MVISTADLFEEFYHLKTLEAGLTFLGNGKLYIIYTFSWFLKSPC